MVTTNFDRLFDLCKADLHTFIPPRLPDLNHPNEFDGTVYLHGKINEDGTGAQNNRFVLSSSEFGDAYLANGWATSFVKGILEKYVVVFVGYSADDPPIHYLLEALNKSSSQLNDIYAFQSGNESYANSKWHHKGVKAIAYENSNGHIALWNTLEAWAERASDSDSWYQEIIAKAVMGPHQLQPFERGQIAHIVSTIEGAKKFANSEMLPPATWLHVFDPELRYETPHKYLSGSEYSVGNVDPFHLYSLNSDITPQIDDPDYSYTKREVPLDAWDAFGFNSLDIKGMQEQRAIGFRGDNFKFPQFSTLPQRLNILAGWLSRVAEQPEAIWWAAKQKCLHPWIKVVLKSELKRRSKDMDSIRTRAWGYIWDGFDHTDNSNDLNWFTLKSSITDNDWSPRQLRHFEQVFKPYIKVMPPYRTTSDINKEQICLSDLIRLDVVYPEIPRRFEISDEWLIRIVEILRRNLELAVELENEIGSYSLNLTSSLTPEKNTDDSYSRTSGLSAWVGFFVTWLDKLIAIDVDAAQKEFSMWRCDDNTVFARLRIWALGKENLVPNESISATLNQLSDEAFWNSYHARDLLLSLAARWKGLDQYNRSTIEDRIFQGPKIWKTEDKCRFKERKARDILDKVTWLEQHGCAFTINKDELIDELRLDTPDWKPEHAKDAAQSLETRGGFVTTNTEYSLLANEPLASILQKAQELSGRKIDFLTESDPFLGLSQEKPIRAFNALIYSAKKGNIVDWAWDTFLYAEDRKNDKSRFTALIAERLSRFTSEELAKIFRSVSGWFERSTDVLAYNYRGTFHKLAFNLIDAMSMQPALGISSIIRGSKAPDWAMESINSPTGNLTSALLQSQQKRTFKPGEGFPEEFLSLLSQLLTLPSDLNRYAMVILSRSLSWCFWVHPSWAKKSLLSVLNSPLEEDRQAFWAGTLWGGVQGKELFTILKPSLLELAHAGEVESRAHQDAIVRLIYSAWKIKDDERWVSDLEFKKVLIKANDNFRCGTLWQSRHGGKNDKEEWFQPFRELVSNVWPKQLVAKSSAVSARFCDIAFRSEEHFPELVKLIVPLLTKLDDANDVYLDD
ncbi:SIR2 family protein, partial [Aliivibrio sp.]|uniref:SIR2 family protein n=1 Tax=Aliivibrio sp. TaxID=1872443 RepID=UPI003D2ED164